VTQLGTHASLSTNSARLQGRGKRKREGAIKLRAEQDSKRGEELASKL
jgi:hypothetical protein